MTASPTTEATNGVKLPAMVPVAAMLAERKAKQAAEKMTDRAFETVRKQSELIQTLTTTNASLRSQLEEIRKTPLAAGLYSGSGSLWGAGT
jgi:hypothetical protein